MLRLLYALIAASALWASTALAGTFTVYPAVGTTVYAEDGVTVIPAVGAIVPDSKYYLDLLKAGQLLTSDPLELSGDPVTISPVTRVSAALVSALTTQLSARPCLIDGEQTATAGYAAAIDGGGATWRCAMGVSSGADGYTKINAANGQWQMILNYGQSVNLRQLGCVPDGTTPCASKLNAFLAMWLALYGTGADLTLDVPSIPRTTTGGYRLEAPGVKIPGQMSLTFVGAGRPYIDGLFWFASMAGSTRSGAVFVADTNVTAFSKLNPADGWFPTIQFRNVGLMGPGGGFTTGNGVDCRTGLTVTSYGLRIAGFNIGYNATSVVSVHGVYDLKTTGCIEGLHIGDTGPEEGTYDAEFYGYDANYNENGLVLEVARDLVFVGGLVQNNFNGIVVGNAAGTHSMRGVVLGLNHLENNGDALGPATPPWGTLGGRPIVFHTGGTIDALTFANVSCGGDPVVGTTPFDFTVPPAANVRFDHSFMSGVMTVGTGAYVELMSASRDSGFTGYSIPTNSTVNWTAQVVAGGGQLSGTYTHDYAMGGALVRRQLTGNVSLPNVTNMPNGHEITFVFIQDGTASRTVTFGAPFVMDTWNNTGFAVAGSRTSVSFVMTDGTLLQKTPQPSWGWKL